MSELFVGKMQYANGTWARVEPLATIERGRWTHIEDPMSSFPDAGLVFVPPSIGLGHVNSGTYWVFTREPNAQAVPGKDQFVVHEAHLAMPIVDLSDKTLEEARVRLFDRGVEFPDGCGDKAVVALTETLCCILDFEPRQNNVRRARPSSNPVSLMSMPSPWLQAGTVSELRFLPLLTVPQLPSVKKVNWCSDAEFVERVLTRARRHAAQFGTPDGLPGKETLQRIARALESGEVILGTGDDVQADMERLRSQWPLLVERFNATQAMTDFVLGSPMAKRLLEEAQLKAADAAAERIRPAVEEEVRAALQAETEDSARRLEQLRASMSVAQSRLDEIQAEVTRFTELRLEAEQQAVEAERKVREVAEGLERMMGNLSPKEVPFARSVVERLGDALGGRVRHLLPDRAPPWTAPERSSGGAEITEDALVRTLKQQAEVNGLSSLLELDAFARAGELVLIVGDCVEQTLIAYAHCVAGGRHWSMTLDPSVIGLDDLWAAPPERSPTGFAAAWSHAERHPDEAVVVCLRAIDASPLHLWLGPLSAVLRSQSRPRNLLVLATLLGTAPPDNGREYPHPDLLLNWLVPVRVSASKDEALASLEVLASGEQPRAVLRMTAGPKDTARLRPAQVAAIAQLRGDALARAARLALLPGQNLDVDGLLGEWVTLMTKGPAESSSPWLGFDELRSLRPQD